MDEDNNDEFQKYFLKYCQQIKKLKDEQKKTKQKIDTLHINKNDVKETLVLLNEIDHKTVLSRLGQKWYYEIDKSLVKQKEMVDDIRKTLSKMKVL
jgi:hypothetical protein